MSYYVAKRLGLEPQKILSQWTPAQLIVAFGHYSNEQSYKNHLEWKNLSGEQRAKIKEPKKYSVLFREISDFDEGE